ncbi:MAG: hypothetical protein PWQ25_1472 [Deferribacteres bacterium]|jgi:cytoskeletal protein RodZ|nr:hypothetical protein [Deferribacteraceae bacterium]MDK2792609.1 hypothetical protein [Deferribacteres bacterium]
MKCLKYRKLIADYADNVLAESLVSEVLEHIADCPDCKKFYLNELKLKDFVKSSYPVNAYKIDVTSSVMSKISVTAKTKKRRLPYFVAASIVFAILGISALLYESNFKGSYMADNTNKNIETASEEKLKELVLEHLDRSNFNNVNTINVSSVVYEK